MRDALYALAFLVIGTLAVAWTAGRLAPRLREPLNVVGGLVARVGAGLILVLAAVRVAAHGGWWLLGVPVLLVPALWSFVLTGLVIWAWTREEPEGTH